MLSFVIPAFNEGPNIGRCVRSVQKFVPTNEPYEIIVVDNGSSDDTVQQARGAGAVVLESAARTIGAVRNEGVRASGGEIIVFLDGDCALTADWERGIAPVLAKVRQLPISAAGSHPIPPPNEDVFLWRHWFVPLFQQPKTSHIGTAHLMCRRDAFDRINGFDERLDTSEDFDLCMRLKAAGGPLLVEPQLTIAHYGFPRTLLAFFRRERWHGAGGISSLRAFVSSKVAILSALFGAASIVALAGVLSGSVTVALTGAVVALGVPVVSVAAKLGTAPLPTQLSAVLIFCVYYSARSLALLDVLARRRPRRR